MDRYFYLKISNILILLFCCTLLGVSKVYEEKAYFLFYIVLTLKLTKGIRFSKNFSLSPRSM